MSLLGALFGLPGARLGWQGQVIAGRVGSNLGQRLGGEVLTVGAVVGNQPLFKEPLSNLGSLLRLVPERHTRGLEQRCRCEGWWRRSQQRVYISQVLSCARPVWRERAGDT